MEKGEEAGDGEEEMKKEEGEQGKEGYEGGGGTRQLGVRRC